jgi:NIMA (never in mitosis gene a)-related kinase
MLMLQASVVCGILAPTSCPLHFDWVAPWLAGTPHYMSPEALSHRPYTFASDMWALGVVLYEMAARRPAFDARGLPQVGLPL